MRVSRARVEEVLLAIVHEVRAEKVTFLAGSIAYHAFLSILPLLLLLLAVLQRTENLALRDSIVGIMQLVLTQQASDVIQQGLTEADASISILGIVILVWGALRIFRGLDTAFSDIYETERSNTFLDQLSDGILLLVTVGIAIIAASLVGNAISLDGDGLLTTLLRGALTTAGLFVVFYPMYYIFPDTDCSLVEVVPGTVFAAVGIAVAQVLFTTFKAGSAGGNLVASIVLLLTWLYVVGLVILLGVAINAVLSNRSGDVDIDPVLGGVPRRKGDGLTTVDRKALLADLDELATLLRERDDPMTVRVAGEEFEIASPETARIESSTAVFGLDDSVGLTLRWWPDTDASQRDDEE
ncbi:YihY/virulence factor BrkB family protein [Haloarcula marina]|uniref:YihY/virulence factor BrkB family protein n=1 Tax=Haloarcula marina TaxID=2961574 RepID=UPI0020B8A9EE|nr:YihY/virulence factor BrkB family protein [Halomicroarcula marina]